jgi:hypothetical protein
MALDGLGFFFGLVLDGFRVSLLPYTTSTVGVDAEVDMDVREALASAPKQRWEWGPTNLSLAKKEDDTSTTLSGTYIHNIWDNPG